MSLALKQLVSNNRKALGGLGLLSLMPLLFSSLIATLLIQHESAFLMLEWSQWLPLFLLSTITMALAMTPSTFIALVCGYFIGWEGAPVMALSYLLASALGYRAGLLLDGGRFLNSVQSHPKVRAFLSELTLKDWPLMFLVRLSPVLPFSVMNLLMPVLKIRFRVFLTAGFIGMLPRTLFSIWLGIQAKGLIELLQSSYDGKAVSILLILLTIISVAGLVLLFLRISRKLLDYSS